MNALYLGTVFQQCMKNCRRGTIHSVFDKVINFVLDSEEIPDSMLSVGNIKVQVNPAMLITDCSISWNKFNIKVGDRVYLYEKYLQIGTIKIDAPKAMLWRALEDEQFSFIEICREEMLIERKKQLSEDLKNYKEKLDKELPYVERKLQEGIDLLGSWIYEETDFVLIADRLLGLGRGLTPTGDDILCGALYGMCFLEKMGRYSKEKLEQFRMDVKKSIHKTSDISQHFLRYAVEGMWGKKEEEFLLAFYSEKELDYREKAKQILQTGASSGVDQMTGILLTLY